MIQLGQGTYLVMACLALEQRDLSSDNNIEANVEKASQVHGYLVKWVEKTGQVRIDIATIATTRQMERLRVT